jgi:hypothetical protein
VRKATTGKPLAGQRNSTRHSPPETGAAARANAASGSADPAQVRHLEKAGGWTRSERLRFLWYRLRLAVQEMNYASRRMVELQMRLPGQPPDQHPDRPRYGQ